MEDVFMLHEVLTMTTMLYENHTIDFRNIECKRVSYSYQTLKRGIQSQEQKMAVERLFVNVSKPIVLKASWAEGLNTILKEWIHV